MAVMPLNDSMFLMNETREQPMHVGGLQLYTPPKGVGPDYLAELYEALISANNLSSIYAKVAYRSARTGYQWAWKQDKDVDLEHHVRHSALPNPGRIRELLALVSRLHGTLLDRHRPLWEAHIIEGLEDGRFAMYTKTHHALLDGVSALRLLERTLSTDPDDHDALAPWERARPKPKKDNGGGLSALPMQALRASKDMATVGPALLKLAEQTLRRQISTLSLGAPRSMLNVDITGARRFAAQSWSLERVRAVARKSNGTINDVILAMCAGALREYMLELDALPETPLIAMTPVSLLDENSEGGGNAVGTILASLATDLDDPGARLEAIHESMNAGKETLKGLSQLQAMLISGAMVSPLLLNTIGLHKLAPPPFNLVISNVPGPKNPLYWNGARLDGLYPLSIPFNGQALNITITSYAGSLDFGLTGCRRSVPRLQRLLGHLDAELDQLEEAVGA